jgi:hypothetical protein
MGRFGQGKATLPENTKAVRWSEQSTSSSCFMVLSIFPSNPTTPETSGTQIDFAVRQVDFATVAELWGVTSVSEPQDPNSAGSYYVYFSALSLLAAFI